jgi:hypothetical protein
VNLSIEVTADHDGCSVSELSSAASEDIPDAINRDAEMSLLAPGNE